MSSAAYVLVIFFSLGINVFSKAICDEDAMSVDDMRKAERQERLKQLKNELRLEDGETTENVVSESSTKKSSDEAREFSDDGASVLKRAMENEGNEPKKEIPNKSKREICDRILQQLRELPCDNPVVITCGGEDRVYPCSPETSLSDTVVRASLSSDVGDILNAAQVPISPVQTIPVSHNSIVSNALPPVQIPQPMAPSTQFLQPNRILTAEERREKQKGIFEGLLRLLFSTVHVFDDVSDPVHDAAHTILGMDAPQFIEDLSLRSYPR